MYDKDRTINTMYLMSEYEHRLRTSERAIRELSKNNERE
jgi:hypothetical protein